MTHSSVVGRPFGFSSVVNFKLLVVEPFVIMAVTLGAFSWILGYLPGQCTCVTSIDERALNLLALNLLASQV